MTATPTALLALLRRPAAVAAGLPLPFDPGDPANLSLLFPVASPGSEVETDYQYTRARVYDPRPGRWLSADPLAYDAAEGDRFPYPQPPSAGPRPPNA